MSDPTLSPGVFLHPLGLLALLAVPAVVAIHLFRRRFQRHTVSALFLWEREDRTALAGRKRERLRTTASFWCELFAALLLALAFAGPRACGAGEAGHLVIALDDSASMAAVLPGGGSIRDLAIEHVREEIARLPRRSRVTLVRSGPRPTLLAGPAAFPEEAALALDAWAPARPRHDLAPALALALQLSGDGATTLVTDAFAPDGLPPEVAVVALGRPLANVGLTHASRARGIDAAGQPVERIDLTLSCFAPGGRRVRLALDAGGQTLEERTLELLEGERRHLSLEVPAGAPALVARLLDTDALAVDDLAHLAPVPPRTVALASTLPPELGRWLGLSTGAEGASSVGRLLDAIPDTVDAVEPGLAHLCIGIGVAGLASNRTWALSFAELGEGRADLIGPFLAERQHALMQGLTLQGVVWSVDPDLALPGAPLVSAGDTPIFTDERRPEGRVLHLDLDPLRSSLQRSPDWPILLANLVELRRRELPGPERANLAMGEAFTYRGEGEATLTLAGPVGARDLPSRGTLVVDDVGPPGTYSLANGGVEVCALAVSFLDPAESDLRGLGEGARASSAGLAGVRAGLGWVELMLAALGLALVLADWLVLSSVRAVLPGEARP